MWFYHRVMQTELTAPSGSLIWVNCPALSVRKVGIITVAENLIRTMEEIHVVLLLPEVKVIL